MTRESLAGEPLLALLEPTASGKTDAAIAIAPQLGAEIISVDSMLVYRGIDVGTAKPTPAQRAAVPHHLVDVVDPAEPFSVSRYQRLARDAIASIRSRDREPLLVGGGGLYVRAVADDLAFPGTDPRVRRLLEVEAHAVGAAGMHARLAELDPAGASGIASENERRTVRALEVAAVTGQPFSSFAAAWGRYPRERLVAAGVSIPREVLHRRIERRVLEMLPGLLHETRALLERGAGTFLTAIQAIGYAESIAYLDGRIGEDEVVARMIRRTKALARRQLAWLRHDPRIKWFEAGEDGALGVAARMLAHLRRAGPAGDAVRTGTRRAASTIVAAGMEA